MNQQKNTDNMDRWSAQRDYLIALIIGQASQKQLGSLNIDDMVNLAKAIDAAHPEPIWSN